MLKTLRQFKEKVTGAGATEHDAADVQRIKEIAEAAADLQRAMAVYLKSMTDFAASSRAVHLCMANLYPAGQDLSNAIATVSSNGKVFADAPVLAEQTQRVFEKPLAAILGRTKDLLSKAEERQVCRAEIDHYREKVTRLANDGLANAKAQSKAESNTDKLHKNQKRYHELDEELRAAMDNLDAELAAITGKALGGFLQVHRTFAGNLEFCYGAAVDAMAPEGGAAAAGGAAAVGGAAASPASPEDEAAEGVAKVSFNDFLGAPANSPLAEAAEPAAEEGAAAAAGAGGAAAVPAAPASSNPFA